MNINNINFNVIVLTITKKEKCSICVFNVNKIENLLEYKVLKEYLKQKNISLSNLINEIISYVDKSIEIDEKLMCFKTQFNEIIKKDLMKL